MSGPTPPPLPPDMEALLRRMHLPCGEQHLRCWPPLESIGKDPRYYRLTSWNILAILRGQCSEHWPFEFRALRVCSSTERGSPCSGFEDDFVERARVAEGGAGMAGRTRYLEGQALRTWHGNWPNDVSDVEADRYS